MQKLFLTFFYVGLSPKAPGTVGSIVAALVAYVILVFVPASTLCLASLCLFLFSIKIIDDFDKSIVIDEVVGVWLALSLSSSTWFSFLFSVIFFRIFDIFKPSIIGRVDRNVKGGLGVMGDDIVAGIFAGLLSAICYGVVLKFGIELPVFDWFKIYNN